MKTIITAASIAAILMTNTALAAEQCPLDTDNAKFQAEIYKLAKKNSPARQNFDALKEHFGLSQPSLDLIKNMNAGKFTKELKFIHAWKDTDKVISLNTKSSHFSQWKTYISPAGQPPGFVAKSASVMGNIGHSLTVLSLAVNVYDAFSGDDTAYKAAVIDIYKASQGVAATQYGSRSLSVAMIGVGFMDYALNKYMKTAYAKYEDYWWTGYDNYLKRTYSRASWAKLYETKGQKGVDARLREFWQDAYVEVGTHNQGKDFLAISANALAMVDYPEPFAARYMAETLAPGLKVYYKGKAEDARIEVEILLERKCDLLVREMGRIEELKKAIDAARIEMNLRAKKANTDAEKQQEVTDTQLQFAEYRQYIDVSLAEKILLLPLGMTADDAFKIGIRAVENGQNFYDAIEHLNRIGREQAAQREKTSQLAAKQDGEIEDTTTAPKEQTKEQVVAVNATIPPAEQAAEQARSPDAMAQYNDGAVNKDLLVLLPDYLERDKRGELSPYGREQLAYLLRIQKNVQGAETPTPMPVTSGNSDDEWGDADDIDQILVSSVSENDKWAIRDQMAAQRQADKARSDAIAGQSFAAIEQRRAEDARIKAEQRRQFAAAMRQVAQGIGQVATEMKEADRRSAAVLKQHRNQTNSNMRDYQKKMNSVSVPRINNSCVSGLMSRKGYPITDPYLARSMCANNTIAPNPKYKPSVRTTPIITPSRKPKYKPPTSIPRYSQQPATQPQTTLTQRKDWGVCSPPQAHDTHYPVRCTVCTSKGGILRYWGNEYHCMMENKPNHAKYIIDIWPDLAKVYNNPDLIKNYKNQD